MKITITTGRNTFVADGDNLSMEHISEYAVVRDEEGDVLMQVSEAHIEAIVINYD